MLHFLQSTIPVSAHVKILRTPRYATKFVSGCDSRQVVAGFMLIDEADIVSKNHDVALRAVSTLQRSQDGLKKSH